MEFLYDEEELPPSKPESVYIPEPEPILKSVQESTFQSKPVPTPQSRPLKSRYAKPNTRLWKLSLSLAAIIILALTISLTMVLAQGQKEIIREMPMTMNIIDDTSEVDIVGFYVDPATDIPIEDVAFGDVAQGVTQHFPIWIKNENVEEPMEIYGELVGDFDNWADTSVDPSVPVLLAPGEVQMFDAIIAVMPLAETGSKAFSFRIVDNEA